MPCRSQNCWRNITHSRHPFHLLNLVLILFLIAVAGCTDREADSTASAKDSAPSRLSVAVTSGPLLQMTATVVGELADVTLIVPPNQTSRNWNPSAEAVATLQSVNLILFSGGGYEPWRNHVSLPMSRVVDTAAGYYSQFIRIPDAVTHQHGPEGSHSHPGTVWATWLDPQLAAAQLDRVVAELSRRDPEHAELFRQNAIPLKSQLEQLDARLTQLAEDSAEMDFRFVSDGPYYQYLTRRFDRPLSYLHWPEDERPLSDPQLTEFVETTGIGSPVLFLLRADGDPKQRQLVESAAVQTVMIDLSEQIADTSVGLTERLKSNIDNLQRAFERLAETSALKDP